MKETLRIIEIPFQAHSRGLNGNRTLTVERRESGLRAVGTVGRCSDPFLDEATTDTFRALAAALIEAADYFDKP